MKGNLEMAIDAFLAERRTPINGELANVTAEDIDRLRTITSLLIHQKWEPNHDGRRPCQVKIIVIFEGQA